MNFFDQLNKQTATNRQHLMAAPIIGRALAGQITLGEYAEFLSQAYHHVKHTVPLLMATGARLPESYEWLRVAVAEYIEEETGHQEWILNDIAACGLDAEAVRNGKPSLATELMVSYAWDTVSRVNPAGFFGMVHVLEGTSISLAEQAANTIRQSLGLPKKAFSYLYSHGALDLEHVTFFEGLMNRITDARDQAQIIHCAQVFYTLYGNIFRAMGEETPQVLAA